MQSFLAGELTDEMFCKLFLRRVTHYCIDNSEAFNLELLETS